MKNKSVHSCRFVHHAKFHCIMTTLNNLFKVEFEKGGGTGKEPAKPSKLMRVVLKKKVQRGQSGQRTMSVWRYLQGKWRLIFVCVRESDLRFANAYHKKLQAAKLFRTSGNPTMI